MLKNGQVYVAVVHKNSVDVTIANSKWMDSKIG